MKKAKVILTSIAVLAVVGGALAFKANTKFTENYCTGTVSGGSCTTQSFGYRVNTGGTASSYYVKLLSGNSCSGQTCGTASSTFVID